MRLSHCTLRLAAAAALLFTSGLASAVPVADPDAEAITALQDAYTRVVPAGEAADFHRDLLATVLQRIKRHHATEVDMPALAAATAGALAPGAQPAGTPAEVFKKAVNTALRAIDPQARYIDPVAHGSERETSGSFVGVGIEVETSGGVVRIVAPIPDSPAQRAGLASGDLIVRIDDTPLAGLPLADALARMRGEPGTAVALTVQRPGASEFTVSVTRDTIRRQMLRWTLEADTLVLRLSGFSGPVSAMLAQAIEDASDKAALRAVVLDMRGNPGGLLREAIRVADAFLDKGEIVSLRGSTPDRGRTWNADADQLLAGIPMVVLVDERSASASELVADALQFHGRATVMGRQSYGKGSVQTTFSLGERKGALKLTTSLYHGPSGQTVHRVGLKPDIELATVRAGTPEQPAAARTTGTALDPTRCPTIKAADPVMSCALAYLQAGNREAFAARLTD